MPKSILDQIENYKENRNSYTAEERKVLRKSLRAQLTKVGKSVVDFIDRINQE